MPRRKKRSKSDRKKFNQCAYCRNHGFERLAKRHRGKCSYNNKPHFDKCNECRQNHRKTINTQNYREKHSVNDSRVSSSTEEIAIPEAFDSEELDIEYESDDLSLNEEYVVYPDGTSSESQNTENTNSDAATNGNIIIEPLKPTSSLNPSPLTIIIMAKNFPFRNLSKKYADEFIQEIDNHPGPSTAAVPRVQYKFYEKGCIKVPCLDEDTKTYVLNLAREFQKRYPRQKILAIDDSNLLTIIKMSCSLRNKENFFTVDRAFMKEIQDKNMLNTSSWFVEKVALQPPSEQKVCFSVDLLSAGYISFRLFHLDIRGECVKIRVRSRKELEEMYALSLL